jgi:hypothetical protein
MMNKYKILPLSGLVICVTGLSIEVRESLRQLCVQQGALYSSDLTKNVTQLITDIPKESYMEKDVASLENLTLKIQYAKKWHIPILHLDWLHKTIQHGFIQDFHMFSIFISNEKRDLENPIRNVEVAALENGKLQKLQEKISSQLPSQPAKPSKSEDLFPRNFAQTSMNLSHSLPKSSNSKASYVTTPLTQSTQSGSSSLPTSLNIPDFALCNVSAKSDKCTPAALRLTPIAEGEQDHLVAFSNPMMDIQRLFTGIYFCINQKLWSLRDILTQAIENHGGRLNWHFAPKYVTHYVCSTTKPIPSSMALKATGTSKKAGFSVAEWNDIRAAQSLKIPIISHHWLLECIKQKSRLPESVFPSHYDPEKARLQFISPILTADAHLSSDCSVPSSDRTTSSNLASIIDNFLANSNSFNETSPSLDSLCKVESSMMDAEDIRILTKRMFKEKSEVYPAYMKSALRKSIPQQENSQRIGNLSSNISAENPVTEVPITVTYDTDFFSQGQSFKDFVISKKQKMESTTTMRRSKRKIK